MSSKDYEDVDEADGCLNESARSGSVGKKYDGRAEVH